MNRKSKRDKLLETTIKLFGQNGFHATAIDRIIEESKVSKKTLYKHFRTKNDSIRSGEFKQKFRKLFLKT